MVGQFYESKMPKSPDSDSLRRADNFAPVISSRGLLGLEIRHEIVSSRFTPLSVIFEHKESQKHRIRIACVVLIIFAPVISSRGLLGLEIRAEIVSSCFSQ